jgi:hypothetical protein
LQTWDDLQENGCDLDSAKIASGEHKYPGPAGSQGGDLQGTVSQPLIFGENNPSPLADRAEPDPVLLIPSEMIVMNLNGKARFDQFRPDWLDAERPVDEEYSSIRRLRSELLLRSH